MGKIHLVFEKELSDFRGRIINAISGICIVNKIDVQVELNNQYGLGGEEAVNGYDPMKKKIITSTGGHYNLIEVETDILLWLLNELEENKSMKAYYGIHVFISRNNGFSVPVAFAFETEKYLNDDEVIEEAVKLELIEQTDADMVDYVEEITEDEYKEMKNA